MTRLQTRYSAAIEAAISQAKGMQERVTVETQDGAEAYAYPHPRGIAWGVNAAETGVNILRGIRRPDGSDEDDALTHLIKDLAKKPSLNDPAEETDGFHYEHANCGAWTS